MNGPIAFSLYVIALALGFVAGHATASTSTPPFPPPHEIASPFAACVGGCVTACGGFPECAGGCPAACISVTAPKP